MVDIREIPDANMSTRFRLEAKFPRRIFGMLFLGIIFYMLYTISIFDIYFRSPLVQDVQPVNVHDVMEEFVYGTEGKKIDPTGGSRLEAPAKRIVLIIGDGVRADKVFELDRNGLPRAPYLRHIIMSRGSWGVSHTRVPTESRPGHVALLAGFYEDVSAVTKGWKVNPVDFDSVINRSSNAFLFGGLGIVSVFHNVTSASDRVFFTVFSPEQEDFAAGGK
jgi:GPI ethanolamine phosphate transferase 1